jgi:hypothetical protein
VPRTEHFFIRTPLIFISSTAFQFVLGLNIEAQSTTP